MIEVWILTVSMWVAQSGVTNQYAFATREKCVAAQKWHKDTYPDRVITNTCYPSLVKK